VNFKFHEDVLYIIDERGRTTTLEEGQQRNKKKKAAGSLHYVAGGI
jgi:hypothetical protein